MKDCEGLSLSGAAREKTEARPIAMRPNDVGFDRIVHSIGNASGERIFIENRDLGKSPFEDGSANTIELVDTLREVAEGELHEARDLAEQVFNDEMYMIG